MIPNNRQPTKHVDDESAQRERASTVPPMDEPTQTEAGQDTKAAGNEKARTVYS